VFTHFRDHRKLKSLTMTTMTTTMVEINIKEMKTTSVLVVFFVGQQNCSSIDQHKYEFCDTIHTFFRRLKIESILNFMKRFTQSQKLCDTIQIELSRFMK
jgi:hypothetical protein